MDPRARLSRLSVGSAAAGALWLPALAPAAVGVPQREQNNDPSGNGVWQAAQGAVDMD